ncbi:MAG: hypothetical protein HS123_15735 [Solibacteraceae bacterium]|nr:hypothetical protein [Solibacteraceae bacterium]
MKAVPNQRAHGARDSAAAGVVGHDGAPLLTPFWRPTLKGRPVVPVTMPTCWAAHNRVEEAVLMSNWRPLGPHGRS